MKRSSLQWKLTLWFSAALVLMAVLTFIVVFFVSHSVLQKQLRTELIHTVEDNVDEVEFYRSIAQMNQDGDTDHYIRYGVGYLEIDDDFLDQVNGMTTALYHENGSLLYGENPIAAAGMLAFEDGVCRTVRVRGGIYLIAASSRTPFAICGCAAPCPKRGPTRRCVTSCTSASGACWRSRSSPLPAAC